MQNISSLLVIIALFHLITATSAQEGAAQANWTAELQLLDREIERHPETGELKWLPTRFIDTFLQLSPEELNLLSIEATQQEKIRHEANSKRWAQLREFAAGRLDSEGCRPAPESWTTGPTALILPSELRKLQPMPTIDQLIERAYVALVLEVSNIESGIGSTGVFATRIEGQIVELLHVTEELSDKKLITGRGEQVEYYTREYDFTFDDLRVCAKRPEDSGFFREEIGDLVLLFGAPNTVRSYIVQKIFPIEDGVVEPQPYPFVVQQSMVLEGIH